MSSKANGVDPQLPLALLRAVRETDTPPELMPEEDLEAAFPQRLGLSGVIDSQIREFRRLARRRRRVEIRQVEALLKLIARRPDADRIFESAGHALAERKFRRLRGLRRLARHLPEALRYRIAARALRSASGDVLIATDVSVVPSPFELRADETLTARVDPDGRACRLYGALAAGSVEAYGASPGSVLHLECEGRGDECCVWRLS